MTPDETTHWPAGAWPLSWSESWMTLERRYCEGGWNSETKNTYQFTPESRDDRYCLINVSFFETTWASVSLTGRINLGLYPRNYVHTYYSTQCGTVSMPLQVATPSSPTSVWILVWPLTSLVSVYCLSAAYFSLK